MKTLLLITALSLATCAMASPDAGDQAPAFQLQASDGKTYTLAEFRDRQGVVIAFFPKAFTGG